MQTSRRGTPYPWSWELPVAALTLVVVLLVLAAHAGRTLANGITVGSWAITPREELFTILPRLLAGDARAGLSPGPAASAGALYAWVALCESLTVAGLVALAAVTLRRWGPSRVRGMAARSECEQLLGLRRLRSCAAVVRPDLHGGSRR